MTTTATLTESQIATVRAVNERPGKHTAITLGASYVAALVEAGMITVRAGKCYPTTAAAAHGKRSKAQLFQADIDARTSLGMGARRRY